MSHIVITNQKTYDRYTYTKRERNSNTTPHTVNKSQGKRAKEEGTKKKCKDNPKTINKMAISAYLSIITLNVKGLNALTKRHIVAKWIQK